MFHLDTIDKPKRLIIGNQDEEKALIRGEELRTKTVDAPELPNQIGTWNWDQVQHMFQPLDYNV